MTHLETSRVREMLKFQISAIRDYAARLDHDTEIEQLETDLVELESSVQDLKKMVEGLPHRHMEKPA